MTAAAEPPRNDAPLFEALLVPYRSLGRRGFRVVMAGLALVSAAVGSAFVANGAWPVVGFFGLDVALVYVALSASNRQARAREEVRVSRVELAIRKVSARGRVAESRYNPRWARLLVGRHPEIGVTGMAVAGEGRRTELGAFLNPADRESFASAFAAALHDVRRR